jgi:hypothetical protein
MQLASRLPGWARLIADLAITRAQLLSSATPSATTKGTSADDDKADVGQRRATPSLKPGFRYRDRK